MCTLLVCLDYSRLDPSLRLTYMTPAVVNGPLTKANPTVSNVIAVTDRVKYDGKL